jgi:hypothetical protein
MTQNQALSDAGRLINSSAKRIAKYIRNINRYFYNGYRKDPIWTQDTYPMGYWSAANPDQLLADLGTLPSINVIRSMIDTIISKLSQTKPLPNFTPIKGTWRTRKVCRESQIYFDDFFEGQKLYKQGVMAARDALLFEYGILWVDDEAKTVRRIAPWEFDYDPAEYNFGSIQRCNIERRDYPLSFLKDKIKKFPDLVALLEKNPGAKVQYNIYYNLSEGQAFEFVETECIRERKLAFDVCPAVFLWYRQPIKGWGSASLADSSMPLQEQIDRTVGTIHEALELNPANTVYIPQPVGSTAPAGGIKASEFSNQIGNIYPYPYVPGMSSSPVTVSTPAPISDQYIQLLQKFIEWSYQMEGISQLSAQSKKPAGINSGVALDTLEDVESERFNYFLQDYIHMFVDLAERCIKMFPKGDDILPRRMGRAAIKWSDIVREQEAFNIQTSPVSNLSRDPKTKMEQVEKLISMQLIKPSMASELLEFADLDKAYSIVSASYDDCQKIIERAIEKREYDFYEVVDLTQLYSEACNTLLMLDADDEDPKVLDNLVGFISLLQQKRQAVDQAANPPPPPAQLAPQGQPGTVPMPVQPPAPMVQPAAPGIV